MLGKIMNKRSLHAKNAFNNIISIGLLNAIFANYSILWSIPIS